MPDSDARTVILRRCARMWPPSALVPAVRTRLGGPARARVIGIDVGGVKIDVALHRVLPPEPGSDGKIAVSLWLARDARVALAAAEREVA